MGDKLIRPRIGEVEIKELEPASPYIDYKDKDPSVCKYLLKDRLDEMGLCFVKRCFLGIPIQKHNKYCPKWKPIRIIKFK